MDEQVIDQSPHAMRSAVSVSEMSAPSISCLFASIWSPFKSRGT